MERNRREYVVDTDSRHVDVLVQIGYLFQLLTLMIILDCIAQQCIANTRLPVFTLLVKRTRSAYRFRARNTPLVDIVRVFRQHLQPIDFSTGILH